MQLRSDYFAPLFTDQCYSCTVWNVKYRESWKTKLSTCLSWDERCDYHKEHMLINDENLSKNMSCLKKTKVAYIRT